MKLKKEASKQNKDNNRIQQKKIIKKDHQTDKNYQNPKLVLQKTTKVNKFHSILVKRKGSHKQN